MKQFYVLCLCLSLACLALCTPQFTQLYTTIQETFDKQPLPDLPNLPKQKGPLSIEPVFKGIPFVEVEKPQIASALAVTIGATLSAAVITDNAPTGASATDVLEYTAVVSNTGSTDATGVVFTDVLDNNTTLVGGSITATPIAVDDAYTCVGNVGLFVNPAQGLLSNDISPTNLTKTITPVGGSSPHGSYTISADGTLVYTPNAGYTGTDNFTYTLNTGTTSSTGTVNITITGMIWFVDASVASSGTGTLANPFKAVSNIAGTAAGQNIFFYTGTYSGAFTALGTQKLIGQGASASLATITGLSFTNAPGSLPSTGGTNATWNSAALTLSSGNDVEGINFNSTSGTTMTGGATNVGALKVRDVSLSNTGGQALQIGSGGALDVIFKSISAAGTAKGISVSSATGSFQVVGTGTTAGSGGTISNMTTRGAEFSSVSNITLTNMNFTNANTTAAASSATDYSMANGAITLNNVSGVTLTKIAISGTTRERGITGKTISNFTLNGGSTLTDCGDDVNEGCLYLQELTGMCSINDATLSKGSENIARVFNSSGALTLNIGTDVTTTTFNDTQAQNANMVSPGIVSALGSYCFIYTTSGSSTATTTLNTRNTSFLKAATHGFKVISDGSGTTNVNVKSCTFNNDNATFSPNDQGGSIELTAFNTANMNYNILNNTCRGKGIALINIVAQIASNAQGRVNNNTVTISVVPNFQSAGYGINLSAQGNSNITTEVTGNTVSGMDAGVGIYATAIGGTGKMNATITGNTVTITNTAASHNIQVEAGNSSSTFGNTTCANVANNITSRPDLNNGVNFRVRAVTTGSHKIYLQGNGTDPNPPNTATGAVYVWLNNGNTPTGAVVSQSGTYGTQIFTSTNGGALATCAVPSNTTYSIAPPPVAEVTTKADTIGKVLTESRAAVEAAEGDPSVFSPSGGSPEGILSGETVTVNGAGSGFTLAANKSTTIKFRATINTGIAAGTCAVSTQGTVSSTTASFASVLTDDPSVGGGSNPTSTTIVVAPTITTCPVSLNNCSTSAQAFAAVAVGCPTPTLTYKIGATVITSPFIFSAGTSTVDVTASNGVGTNATCSFTVTIATSNTWTGATSTDWSTTTNWFCGTIPNSTSVVVIPTTTNAPTLTSAQTVGNLSLTGTGKLILGNNNLTVNTVSGSNTAYVVTNGTGSLTIKNIAFTATTFPVGPSASVYAPAIVTNNIARDFTVKVGTTISGTVAPARLVNLQWDVTPSVLTGNSATLALGWSAASQGVGFTPSSGVVIGHYNGSVWDNLRAATVTGAGPYIATVSGVNAFSPFVVANSSALSVELLDFKGTPQYNGNFLTWTTANEVNNKGFNVERLMDNGQLTMNNGQWQTLGFVNAKGKSSTYEYLDNQPFTTSYYRLRQIDNDGKETLSKVISVANVDTHGRVYLRVYPNPVSNVLMVEYTDLSRDSREGSSFQVINLLGQQVLSGKTPPSGVGGLDVSELPKGAYFLRIGEEQVKFVKQ
jgi:trimeric autotransporter adhesin